ncbi:MAG: Uma2 family endonuclease [Planctomycetaceae bacterium]|nr:Uma2 family endonuclease [Planctomycetaceae bacterium]
MASAAVEQLMTVDDLLALPENGMDRDLFEGLLRERPMTRRNRRHARTTFNAGHLLGLWRNGLKTPRGELLVGDAAFCLERNPDTTVGIDIAYISADLASQAADDTFLINGAPILAAEILSPSDTHEDLVEKIELFLRTGVQVVWIIDPDLRTVTVYRPGTGPVLFNALQELSGDPELPGFRMPVAALFAP